jgi:tetratricopeptide (TPR) repeat protein
MNKNISILLVVTALIILALVWAKLSAPEQGSTVATTTSTAATSSIDVTATTSDPGVVIKPLPPIQNHPQINRPLQFATTLDVAARAGIQDKVNRQQAFVEKTPNDPFLWINLGTLRLMAGDTSGAKEAWGYVKILAPKDSVPYFNLAAMYADNLKDYPAAVAEYEKALDLAPQGNSGYMALAQIYMDAYKTNTDLAEKTLLKGIAAIRNPYDLQVMLARHYKSKNRMSDSIVMYERALQSARAVGAEQAVTDIEQESKN